MQLKSILKSKKDIKSPKFKHLMRAKVRTHHTLQAVWKWEVLGASWAAPSDIVAAELYVVRLICVVYKASRICSLSCGSEHIPW